MHGKPQNIAEYHKWLKSHNINNIDRIKNRYNTLSVIMKAKFETSAFWAQLLRNIDNYNAKYYLATGYHLFANQEKPEIFIKEFDPFLLKTYRLNVILNNNWPKEPSGGWIIPDKCYDRINDILRTLITVKYLDGVDFIVEEIKLLCQLNNKECKVDFEAKDDGYYAVHIYIKETFEVPRASWDTEIINLWIEMQVTTQLQEVIRKLTHKYYEDRRKRIEVDNLKWQWNYESKEFMANYLGHILHYIEGMIMEVRKQDERVGKGER